MTKHVDLNEDSTIQNLLKGNVSEDYKNELKQAFELFDADHDGRVTTTEISTIMRSLGMFTSECQMEELLSRLDTDGNGTVEYAEFEEFMLTMKNVKHMADETDEDMMNAFKILDEDGDGYITREELKKWMSRISNNPMSDADADELINELDKNGDGKIDYKEYKKHIQMQM